MRDLDFETLIKECKEYIKDKKFFLVWKKIPEVRYEGYYIFYHRLGLKYREEIIIKKFYDNKNCSRWHTDIYVNYKDEFGQKLKSINQDSYQSLEEAKLNCESLFLDFLENRYYKELLNAT